MRHTSLAPRLFVLATAFAVAGCFKLGRTTPPVSEYVLGGIPIAPGSSRGASVPDTGGLTIGLRRMDLAPYLATPSIVVRRGTQIVTSQYHRWAEDPAAGIPRTIAAYLTATSHVRAVDIAPWPVRALHDYVAEIHVSRMEGVAPTDTSATQGEVVVIASWEIIRPADGVLVARGETVRRSTGWRVGDHAALVTLLDNGLNGLASDLAACLERLAGTEQREMAEWTQPLACAPRT